MIIKPAIILSVCSICFANAQQKSLLFTEPVTHKKTIQLGVQTSLGAGFSTAEGKAVSAVIFNPKASYFITDKLSLGVGYLNLSTTMQPTAKMKLYHDGEVELKYYFRNSGRILFYTQAGFLYGQFSPTGVNAFSTSGQPGAMLKFGAGLSWRFKNNPNLAFNLEVINYFNLHPQANSKTHFMPNISVGISYFFNHKKKKVISQKAKQLGQF